MSAALQAEHPPVNDQAAYGQQDGSNAVNGRSVTTSEEAADSVPGPIAPTGARSGRIENLRMWQPGQSGNPTGKQGKVTAMRQLAASKTVEAMEALIAIMSDPTEDGRVRVVAAQAVLDRGAGKVTELVPTAPPAMTLDLARLSADQLAALRAILDSGAFVPAPEPASDEPPTIDGSAS